MNANVNTPIKILDITDMILSFLEKHHGSFGRFFRGVAAHPKLVCGITLAIVTPRVVCKLAEEHHYSKYLAAGGSAKFYEECINARKEMTRDSFAYFAKGCESLGTKFVEGCTSVVTFTGEALDKILASRAQKEAAVNPEAEQNDT